VKLSATLEAALEAEEAVPVEAEALLLAEVAVQD
jgi:hypothetical protein